MLVAEACASNSIKGGQYAKQAFTLADNGCEQLPLETLNPLVCLLPIMSEKKFIDLLNLVVDSVDSGAGKSTIRQQQGNESAS